MNVSKEEAIDAIDDLLSDLQGASEALSLFGAAEGLDLPIMVSRTLDRDVPSGAPCLALERRCGRFAGLILSYRYNELSK